jgi:peptidoglycan/LPS O-acetylase OafA/YrhL
MTFSLKHSWIALLYALLVLRLFLHEPGPYHWLLRRRALTAAGIISYGLYMYHQPVNGLFHGFLFNQEPHAVTNAEFLVGIIVMAISIALATLSYIYLERPIRRFAQRISFKKSGSLGTPVATAAQPAQ